MSGFQAYWNNGLVLARDSNGALEGLRDGCEANLTRARYGLNCIAFDTFKLTFSVGAQDVYVRRNRNFDTSIHPIVDQYNFEGFTPTPADDVMTDSWVNYDITAELLEANYGAMVNASYQMTNTGTASGGPPVVIGYGSDPTVDPVYNAAQTSSLKFFLNGDSSDDSSTNSDRSIRMHVGSMPETYGSASKYFIAVLWTVGNVGGNNPTSPSSLSDTPGLTFLGVKFLDSIPDLTPSGPLWPLTIDNFVPSITSGAQQAMPWWWSPLLYYGLSITATSGTYALVVHQDNASAVSPATVGTTSSLAFNASASTIQTALEAIVGAGNILVLGTFPNYTIVPLGNISQGPSASIIITVTPTTGFAVTSPSGSFETGGIVGTAAVLNQENLSLGSGLAQLKLFTPFLHGFGGSVTITPVDRACRPACGDYCEIFAKNPSVVDEADPSVNYGAAISIDGVIYQSGFNASIGDLNEVGFAWKSYGAGLFDGSSLDIRIISELTGEPDHNLYSSYPLVSIGAAISGFGEIETGVQLKAIPGHSSNTTLFQISYENSCGDCGWEFPIFKQVLDAAGGANGAGYWVYACPPGTDFTKCPPLDFSAFSICRTGTLWGTKPSDPVIVVTPPSPLPCVTDCSSCTSVYTYPFFYRGNGKNTLVKITLTRSGCVFSGSATNDTEGNPLGRTVTLTIQPAFVTGYVDCRWQMVFSDGVCSWPFSTDMTSVGGCPPAATGLVYDAALATGGSSCPPPVVGAPITVPISGGGLDECNCTACAGTVHYSGTVTVATVGTITFSGNIAKGVGCNYSDTGVGTSSVDSTPGDIGITLACDNAGIFNWAGQILDVVSGSPISYASPANTNATCPESLAPISFSGTDGSGNSYTGTIIFS